MSYYEALGLEWDRQWREPRDTHQQRALSPIECKRHGLWMPRHIADGDCPDCYREMCDGDDMWDLFPRRKDA
jgi:hypothetical protein